jgi:hypothetical protein
MVIDRPIAAAGRGRLDFGQGFYVTDIKRQADSWAERMQRIREEPGVANDRVIDTVEAYMANLMPLETALRELSRHQPNNQLCIASQKVIDECMTFVESYNI